MRVIDASVIPTIFSGHPNAVVIALAEMAASYLRSAN
ncbi:MAG TPA: GMC oxidoreductase [Acidobacteriota bacterium]|nr:GMC oxidoreductase [Acidobacteriota bacterium]